MSQIDRIVQVDITRGTQQIDIASFDIPLILTRVNLDETPMVQRVQTFTSLEGVGEVFGIESNAYTVASKLLSGDIRPSEFKIAYVGQTPAEEEGDPDILETYAEALQAAILEDNEWYALLADTHLDGDILAMAAIIQAQRKMYFTSSNSSQILDASFSEDIGSVLKDSGYTRTALIYSQDADNFPEAAWVGSQLPEIPGSNTWEYKRLSGVQVSTLTDTQINTLENKNVNYFIRIKGAAVTRKGVVGEGAWIDEINEENSLLVA